AQKNGTFARYVEAMYAAMWEQSLKMDELDPIVEVMNQAGLDGAAFKASIDDPEVKQQLVANTQAAVERGAFGSPTFFVNDEMYFGKDQLRDVEEEIARLKAL